MQCSPNNPLISPSPSSLSDSICAMVEHARLNARKSENFVHAFQTTVLSAWNTSPLLAPKFLSPQNIQGQGRGAVQAKHHGDRLHLGHPRSCTWYARGNPNPVDKQCLQTLPVRFLLQCTAPALWLYDTESQRLPAQNQGRDNQENDIVPQASLGYESNDGGYHTSRTKNNK